jgi:thioredoxin-related protein
MVLLALLITLLSITVLSTTALSTTANNGIINNSAVDIVFKIKQRNSQINVIVEQRYKIFCSKLKSEWHNKTTYRHW